MSELGVAIIVLVVLIVAVVIVQAFLVYHQMLLHNQINQRMLFILTETMDKERTTMRDLQERMNAIEISQPIPPSDPPGIPRELLEDDDEFNPHDI